MWHIDEIVEFSENDILHQTKSFFSSQTQGTKQKVTAL